MNETPNTPPQAAPAPRQGFLGELRDAVARTNVRLGDRRAADPAGLRVLLRRCVPPSPPPTGCRSPSSHRHRPPASSSASSTRSTAARSTPPPSPMRPIGRTLLRHGSTSGLLIVNPDRQDRRAARRRWRRRSDRDRRGGRHRAGRSRPAPHATVTDAVPAQPGDARGLTDFYLVVGWLIGGYLVAALLEHRHPATTRHHPPGDHPPHRARPLRHPLRTRRSHHRRPRPRCAHRPPPRHLRARSAHRLLRRHRHHGASKSSSARSASASH